MRHFQILIVAGMAIVLGSCRTEGNLMLRGSVMIPKKYKPDIPSSYIQLDDGKKLPIAKEQEITAQTYIVWSTPASLSLQDTTIMLKDMHSLVLAGKSWQTRSFMYGIRKNQNKIMGTSFATMALKGPKINYYIGHSAYANSTSTSTDSHTGEQTTTAMIYSGTSFYIQKGDSGIAERFEYKELRKMIPMDDAASKYLLRYARHKKTFNTVRWAGLGCLVVGGALMATGKSPISNVGGGMLIMGLPIITVGGIMQSKNIKHNLHHAFYLYNGMSRRRKSAD